MLNGTLSCSWSESTVAFACPISWSLRREKDIAHSTNPRVVEQKTERAPILYLSSMKELIQAYTKDMQEEDFLFPSAKGGHLAVNTVYQMFQKAADFLEMKNIGTYITKNLWLSLLLPTDTWHCYTYGNFWTQLRENNETLHWFTRRGN